MGGGLKMEKLVFKKIVNKDIFNSDYKNFIVNNEISFSSQGISVIYGPNGTGKTSLINTLKKNEQTEFIATYEGKEYSTSSDEKLFCIISDQNNRNIIEGETQDFLLGDNIRKEHELSLFLEEGYHKIKDYISSSLKKDFNLSKKTSNFIKIIKDVNVKNFVVDLINVQSKGKNYDVNTFVNLVKKIKIESELDCDEAKFNFFINDFNEKDSIISAILEMSTSELTVNAKIHELEENEEALKILTKFIDKNTCVVCDNTNINPAELCKKKQVNKESIINSLDKKLKTMIEHAISISPISDPFDIKQILINSIDKGEFTRLLKLKEELALYKEIYNQKILILIKASIFVEGFEEKNDEYNSLITKKPEIIEEDVIYIEEIIKKSMGKDLQIVRDKNHNLRILLEENEFINKARNELPLSAGEQNFLSLTFEFLKAKNSEEKIVIIDDPISSFDSIYKNKIVFSLVRMLTNKNRIILTHNLDLVRLLNGQYKNCFNLYIMENSNGASSHGFIPLNEKEKDMLIDLNKLLNMFRSEIFSHIQNKKAFLLSMIPFMRGYAHIVNNKVSYEKLTQVMHGYTTGCVDIAEVYKALFGEEASSYFSEPYVISVQDILDFNIDTTDILDNCLPLLHKTLKHTFTYLSLRLLVEKTLVEKYSINTDKAQQLGDIIVAAFPNSNDINQIKNRVDLTSKKTLLNEFNHFEGNLSIFQPAIDITDTALGYEKTDVINFVDKIKREL